MEEEGKEKEWAQRKKIGRSGRGEGKKKGRSGSGGIREEEGAGAEE